MREFFGSRRLIEQFLSTHHKMAYRFQKIS